MPSQKIQKDAAAEALVIGAKTRLKGQACMLLDDVVSRRLPASMQDSILISRAEPYFFYCAASAFAQLRAAEPALPIYGFWQLLHASGLLDERNVLTVVYAASDEGRFFYCAEDKSLCISGEIRGGKPLINSQTALPDLSTAKVLNLEEVRLRLPDTPVLTLSERNRIKHEANKFRVVNVLAALFFFAAGLFPAHDYLAGRRADEQRAYETARAQLDLMHRRRAAFVSAGDESWPWQWPVLETFYHLAAADENLDVWGIDLNQAEFEARLKPSFQLPDFMLHRLDELRYRQDGSVVVRWSRPS